MPQPPVGAARRPELWGHVRKREEPPSASTGPASRTKWSVRGAALGRPGNIQHRLEGVCEWGGEKEAKEEGKEPEAPSRELAAPPPRPPPVPPTCASPARRSLRPQQAPHLPFPGGATMTPRNKVMPTMAKT